MPAPLLNGAILIPNFPWYRKNLRTFRLLGDILRILKGWGSRLSNAIMKPYYRERPSGPLNRGQSFQKHSGVEKVNSMMRCTCQRVNTSFDKKCNRENLGRCPPAQHCSSGRFGRCPGRPAQRVTSPRGPGRSQGPCWRSEGRGSHACTRQKPQLLRTQWQASVRFSGKSARNASRGVVCRDCTKQTRWILIEISRSAS